MASDAPLAEPAKSRLQSSCVRTLEGLIFNWAAALSILAGRPYQKQ